MSYKEELPIGSVYTDERGVRQYVTGELLPHEEPPLAAGQVVVDVNGQKRYVTTEETAVMQGEPYIPVILSRDLAGSAHELPDDGEALGRVIPDVCQSISAADLLMEAHKKGPLTNSKK